MQFFRYKFFWFYKKLSALYVGRIKHIIGEKNNYVKLFEAIELQSEYDEAAIRQKFRHEKFIKQEWNKIDQEEIDRIVSSMRKRCANVVAKNGAHLNATEM